MIGQPNIKQCSHYLCYMYTLGVERYVYSSQTITVRFMNSDGEYSQSQAIHTTIQKGAHTVIQCCLLTTTKGKRAEEQYIHK